MYRFLFVTMLIGVLAPVMVYTARAQASPFTLIDESDSVDASEIEAAAQPLIARNASVGVIISDENDPTTHMLDAGLMLTESPKLATSYCSVYSHQHPH